MILAEATASGNGNTILMIVLIVLLVAMLIALLFTMRQVSELKYKINAFTKGKNGKSLEDSLIRRLSQIDELMEANSINEMNIRTIESRTGVALQKCGLVKYDAFKESSGKLSFTVCLLNERNDGFILNAIHGSEGCYTYMKEIVSGNPITKLSDEEEEALEKAKEGY